MQDWVSMSREWSDHPRIHEPPPGPTLEHHQTTKIRPSSENSRRTDRLGADDDHARVAGALARLEQRRHEQLREPEVS
eukprot:2384883-Rhodomonas_salina.3